MSWLKLDDGFAEHPKIVAVSERARWLHVTALCYCGRNLTDGYLDPRAVKVVTAIVDRPCKQAIADLVKVGLWDEAELVGGYTIRDYLDYNPHSAEVKELREQRREAGRRGGIKSGETRRSKTKQDEALASSKEASVSVEPRPVPSRKASSKAFGFDIRETIEKSLREVA